MKNHVLASYEYYTPLYTHPVYTCIAVHTPVYTIYTPKTPPNIPYTPYIHHCRYLEATHVVRHKKNFADMELTDEMASQVRTIA